MASSNLHAERGALNLALWDAAARATVLARLESEDFTIDSHRAIFEALRSDTSAVRDRIPVEELLRRLRERGQRVYAETAMLLDVDLADPARLEDYCANVRSARVSRELEQLGRETSARAQREEQASELLDRARGELERLTEISSVVEADHWATAIDEVVSAREERPVAEVAGVTTGVHRLDVETGGLRPGQFWILAGRPGMGKSILALQAARAAAIEEGMVTLLFSYEMTRREMAHRALAAESGIPVTDIKSSQINATQRRRLRDTAQRIRRAPLFIEQRPLSASELEAAVLKRLRAGGADLVLVDYLQLVKPERRGDSPFDAVSYTSRKMKEIAMGARVPVIGVSQLSRSPEHRADSRPRLSDLRQTGSLEQDADVVIGLYRPSYYGEPGAGDDALELRILKQRDGRAGITISGRFDGATARVLP